MDINLISLMLDILLGSRNTKPIESITHWNVEFTVKIISMNNIKHARCYHINNVLRNNMMK